MHQIESNLSRRTALKFILFSSFGLTFSSCFSNKNDVSPTIPPQTTNSPTNESITPLPTIETATQTPATPEVFSPEVFQNAENLEAILWQADPSNGVHFYTDLGEDLHFTQIDFQVKKITPEKLADGSILYRGQILNVTGDPRKYYVNLALQDKTGLNTFAKPIEAYQSENTTIEANYLYLDGEESYLNKQLNIAQTLRFLAETSTIPIKAHGGHFSLLDRSKAFYNFELSNLYHLGWNQNVENKILTQAGEALGIATALSRAFAQVDGQTELDQINTQAYFDPYNKKYTKNLEWTNQTDHDLYLIPKISLIPYGEFPRWWSAINSPSPIRMAISISLSKNPPTSEDINSIKTQYDWLEEYQKTRPNAIEISEEKTYRLEAGPSFYDSKIIDETYTIHNGKKMEDISVDPVVMEVVKKMNLQASGDITNLLFRAIPTDAALELGYKNSEGIRFSYNYHPREPMVTAEKMGLNYFQGKGSVYLNMDAAQSLFNLQKIAQTKGIYIYLFNGYRDYLQQWIMNKATPEGGAGSPGASEHVTGLAADLYTDFASFRYPDYSFQHLANQHGWVNSLSMEGDPPHFFYLDGVWPGLTKALLDAGLNVNERYTSVQARIAVFQTLAAQATASKV